MAASLDSFDAPVAWNIVTTDITNEWSQNGATTLGDILRDLVSNYDHSQALSSSNQTSVQLRTALRELCYAAVLQPSFVQDVVEFLVTQKIGDYRRIQELLADILWLMFLETGTLFSAFARFFFFRFFLFG